jgi:glucose/arabinose dehydrogenase
LYINDNGANATQGNTPGSSDGCATPSIDPGDHDDAFNLFVPGKYYGHPTPARGQCVFLDGSIYAPPLSPDPNWMPPLASYYGADSSDGIVEYTATTFGGALQHQFIVATFSDDELVRRVALSPDGSTVEGIVAIGKYNQPLDVWTDAAGHIFVAEYTGNQISVLVAR